MQIGQISFTRNFVNMEKQTKPINPDYKKTYADFYPNYKSYIAPVLSSASSNAKIKTQNADSLFEITKDEQKSKTFFDEILKEPRKSKSIVQDLCEKAGGVESFTNWYFAKDGYKAAYEKYMRNVYQNAKEPDDLLKFCPNWHYEALEEKFGRNYSFGEIPKEIGTKEDYQNLVRSALRGEENPDIKEIPAGASKKRIFILNFNDKKYILKVQNDYLLKSDALKEAAEKDPSLEEFFQKYKDNENMRSDSVFLNAMIDRYLNLNNCENAIKMHYFDFETSSALYEFAKGENSKDKINALNLDQHVKDLSDMGIVYNDISGENLQIFDDSIKIIDSGESNYIDILKPGIPGLQFELPNWSGNSIASFRAGIFALGL